MHPEACKTPQCGRVEMLKCDLGLVARGGYRVGGLAGGPHGVEPAVLAIVALIGMRAEEVALRLHQVGRQVFPPVLVEVAERRADARRRDACVMDMCDTVSIRRQTLQRDSLLCDSMPRRSVRMQEEARCVCQKVHNRGGQRPVQIHRKGWSQKIAPASMACLTMRRHESWWSVSFLAKYSSMSRFSSAGSRSYACLISSRKLARMMQPPCGQNQPRSLSHCASSAAFVFVTAATP